MSCGGDGGGGGRGGLRPRESSTLDRVKGLQAAKIIAETVSMEIL